MTDARTDEIANEAAGLSRLRPWLFVNELSRLVVDPERFPDPADELMAAPEIGMGAVYTRTANGDALRHPDAVHSQALIDTYFTPYADALTSLVAQRLQNTGGVTIIDLHSYPLVELPYERHVHPDAPRPACCIGTDPQHTLPALAAAVATAFARLGETAVNEPFAGTYVPLAYFGSDPRVQSVMVELRRDTYLDEPAGIDQIAAMLAALVDAIDADRGRPG